MGKRRRADDSLIGPLAVDGWKFTPPDAPAFLNPFDDHVLLAYYERIFDWHGYIRFLGLPHLRDNPDVLIQHLFVEPSVSPQYIHPDLLPERWPPSVSSFEALQASPRAVLLGDPGSGKSTFVSWLAWQFTRPEDTSWTQHFGRLVPLPMVLRELPIGKEIDWDGLLAAFLAHPVAEPLRARPDLLASLLEHGQAFILLDGLDEIGSVEIRKAVCGAARDAFARHPKCRWLITSRIVGYEDAPLASREGKSPSEERPPGWRPDKEDGPVDVRYIAPFSDQQIEVFVRNWYALREGEAAGRDRKPYGKGLDRIHELLRERVEASVQDKARKLVTAIMGKPSTHRLARIPNLLTLMALIYRVQAKLPYGRALLYEKIAEAYLESIDEFRGLREVNYSLEEKKGWLAHVGFQMQRRRSEGSHAQEEILVPHEELLVWLTKAIAASERGESEAEARTFIDYIGRRSGLLLPRGEGRFAFMHLSFQEYFAAWHLAQQITAPGGLQQQGGVAGSSLLDGLRGWAGQSVWRETIVLLFELLALRPRWADELADALFGRDFERLPSDGGLANDALVRLAAELSVDPHSGLGRERRVNAWKACWSWFLNLGDQMLHGLNVPRSLTAAEQADLPTVWQAFLAAWHLNSSAGLRLDGCTGVTDLEPLAGLAELKVLVLNGCTGVTDLEPLAGLAELKVLVLNGCTGVMDLAPLARLPALQHLELQGCTGVTDLAPLAGLAELKVLFLGGCTGVTDLAPIAGLPALDNLSLMRCTGVTDLAPLAGLRKLRMLWLDGFTVDQVPKALLRRAALRINGLTHGPSVEEEHGPVSL